MLRREHVGIVKFIGDTVKAATGGSVPRGTCYTDSPDLDTRYKHGDHVGNALGIRIQLNTSIAYGWASFDDSNGTTVCFAAAF